MSETKYRVVRRPRGNVNAEWRVTRDQSPYWDSGYEYRVQEQSESMEWRNLGDERRRSCELST